MKQVVTLGMVVLLTGCAAANISSQVRESGSEGSSMMTRCVEFSTGNEGTANSKLQKYDGWKMVYVSEYTTPNKVNSAAVMCFEKPSSLQLITANLTRWSTGRKLRCAPLAPITTGVINF